MKNGGAARPAAARKWRTAGKVNAAAARVRAAWRGSWSVGAACMRPAAVYPTNPFFGRDRVWSMRRGGIDAARKHCGHCPLPGRLLFVLPCRAGDFARRTDNFFNFYNVRRIRSCFPQPPHDHVPLPGGIYASPTNTRNRVYDTGDGWRRKVYGPHTCGPYNARQTTGKLCTGGKARELRRKRATNHAPRALTARCCAKTPAPAPCRPRSPCRWARKN